MFMRGRDQGRSDRAAQRETEAKFAAIQRSQAVIEFELDGTVISANQNFLDLMGYSAGEVVGRGHSMFIDPAEAAGPEYKAFWARLNRGDFVAGRFRRIARGGREVWIQASYTPVLDEQGRPCKVIKLATDVTAQHLERLQAEAERNEAAGQQHAAMQALAEGLRRLSEGDLTVRLDGGFDGGYAGLRDDFNAAVASVRKAMGAVVLSTDGLRSGADEIAAASDDLSRRTEQQAASLEETAAALDQITATVSRSAQGAKQAAAAASGAKADAAHSGEVVHEAVAAMGEIEQSSRKITEIIGVIDEIAFQTNLLALNAGVEAARAGEAGKGFAVVAQEVRALAQRSAEAAKEIKALISSSTEQVGRGVKLVDQTGDALATIVAKVTEIDALISEIAQSSQEQATGLAQVNSALNQMDQVTQQNAAMVEEATAAAMALRNQSLELVKHVGRFRLGDRPKKQADPAVQRAAA